MCEDTGAYFASLTLIASPLCRRTKVAFERAEHGFVIWLSPYNPELNLIEGLWGYLKHSGLNSYFCGELETLEEEIHKTMADLQQHPETAMPQPTRHHKTCAGPLRHL